MEMLRGWKLEETGAPLAAARLLKSAGAVIPSWVMAQASRKPGAPVKPARGLAMAGGGVTPPSGLTVAGRKTTAVVGAAFALPRMRNLMVAAPAAEVAEAISYLKFTRPLATVGLFGVVLRVWCLALMLAESWQPAQVTSEVCTVWPVPAAKSTPSWQVPQVWRVGNRFQFSPWAVALGSPAEPEWHLLHMRCPPSSIE